MNQSEMDVAAQVRSALVDTISSERYELWIADDTQWSWIDGALRIDFKNDFTCQLAKRMLSKDISAAVQGVMGCAAQVHFDVRVKPETSPATEFQSGDSVSGRIHNRPRSVSATPAVDRTDNQQPAKQPSQQQLQHSPRQQNELWEQFVQGPSNQLAWTTANLIVSEPGRLSPVVLHGPNGCGKSLLA
ncbi:MAG: DnaA/Hda family protein, partial [Aureliella sp.]